jgi:hypothetical protein
MKRPLASVPRYSKVDLVLIQTVGNATTWLKSLPFQYAHFFKGQVWDVARVMRAPFDTSRLLLGQPFVQILLAWDFVKMPRASLRICRNETTHGLGKDRQGVVATLQFELVLAIDATVNQVTAKQPGVQCIF